MRYWCKLLVAAIISLCYAGCGLKSDEETLESKRANIVGTWRNSDSNSTYEEDSILVFKKDGDLEILSWLCKGEVLPLKAEDDNSIYGKAMITKDGGVFYIEKVVYLVRQKTIEINSVNGGRYDAEFFFDKDILVLSLPNKKKIRFKKLRVREYRELKSPTGCSM